MIWVIASKKTAVPEAKFYLTQVYDKKATWAQKLPQLDPLIEKTEKAVTTLKKSIIK